MVTNITISFRLIVRPKKVLDAAKYLVDTGELFKTEGIKVQNAWLDGITSQPMKSGVSLFKTLTHPEIGRAHV